ncbi:hypothetical protein C8J55DRAFT_602567 [Lentinula edodes]|uniref:Uncharacterized protein n=1 Tax=Lentinula lateritia TaxID=40482 RepID=A0A9W9B1D1_9AGAR|nr:hypothetical protein C8J55DRAFT_602567 [Lentinula edodes]
MSAKYTMGGGRPPPLPDPTPQSVNVRPRTPDNPPSLLGKRHESSNTPNKGQITISRPKSPILHLLKKRKGIRPMVESDIGEDDFTDAEEGEIEDVPPQTLNPKPNPLPETASLTETFSYALDLIMHAIGKEQMIEWSDQLGYKAMMVTDVLLTCTPGQHTPKQYLKATENRNDVTIVRELQRLSRRLNSMVAQQHNPTSPTLEPASTNTKQGSTGITSVHASGPVYSPKFRKPPPMLPQSRTREPESPLDRNHPARLIISLRRDAPQKSFVPRIAVNEINKRLSNAVDLAPNTEKIRVTSANRNYKGSIILTTLENQRGDQLSPLVPHFLDILTDEPLSKVRISTDEPRVRIQVNGAPTGREEGQMFTPDDLNVFLLADNC